MSANAEICVAAAMLPAGFVFGYAIATLADMAMIRHWRNKSARDAAALNDLVGSCRKVLADSWYNRVMRNWRWCYGGGNGAKEGCAE